VANSLKELIEAAYIDGKHSYSTFRRVNPFITVAGYWADLSMSTGGPPPNYYLGTELRATVPTDWYRKGLWHGSAALPDKKYLHKVCLLGTAAAAAPAPFILCDYLMYYPLIDMDSTEEQLLINYGPVETMVLSPEAAVLPRYTDGVGVQAFLVATNPFVGGAYFQIKYTNEHNVSGRLSGITLTNTSTNIGTILNSHTAGLLRYGAFIQLQQGDQGITSVQAITFSVPNGGLAALVLVKVIATMMTKDPAAWAEFDFVRDKPSLPRIYDNAYLNLLVMPSATIAAVPIAGEITTIWGS
jgi:hypothetical protein